MQQMPLYLDNNATTPVDPSVLDAMMPFFNTHFGNAASKTHVYGWMAEEAVEMAREEVAALIEANPDEIVFTSGSTEAVNMAIKGVYESYAGKGNHIITLATEHKAVLDTLTYLEKKGARITRLPVSREGLLDPGQLEKAITSSTILIVVMAANNETGVIQPVETIGAIAADHGVLFFTDATQAAGKSRLSVNEIKASLLCLSAHKIYGPKGVGALYVKKRNPKVKLEPLIHGGGHEHGLRSGTLHVPGIVGLGAACKLAGSEYWEFTTRVSAIRTTFEQRIMDLGNVTINGSTRFRLPNTSNLLIHGVLASSLIKALPSLAFAAGSACSSSSPEPSHVLMAMGLTREQASCSVRISFGKQNTGEESMEATVKMTEVIRHLRNSG